MKPIFTILVFISSLTFSIAQDTISIRLDTTYCLTIRDTIKIQSTFKTDSFNFKWSNGDTTTFTTIFESDTISLMRYNLFSNKTYIDCFYVRLNILPVISFAYDTICFGTPTKIHNLSSIDTSITKITYKIGSSEFTNNKKEILHFLPSNPDSALVDITFKTMGCKDTFTSIKIKNKFKPQIKLNYDQVCFGNPTKIFNKSIFNPDKATVKIKIDEIDTIFSKSDFIVELNKNGEQRNLNISIEQNGCKTTLDTTIINKKKPIASFQSDNTCENILLEISNNSTDYLSDASISIQAANKNYLFTASDNLQLSDYLNRGTYNILAIIDNKNGCRDSLKFDATILDVDSVAIKNLDDYYCERQDIETITGVLKSNHNPIEGSFSGNYITQLMGIGQAKFEPTAPGKNIVINFSHTNQNKCTDIATGVVLEVYPKPELALANVKDQYCLDEDASLIVLNKDTTNGMSKFTITKDGSFYAKNDSFKYTFTLSMSGNFKIRNDYVDSNGCINFIVDSTIVNPLPQVNLGPDTTITPGDSMTIGPTFIEPSVIYNWSNNSQSNSINVELPGLYSITANNILTGCEAKDSIEIKYDDTIFETLVKSKIFPNPTNRFLNVNLATSVTDITITSLMGDIISIGGASQFSTDSNGNLTLDLGSVKDGQYCLKIPGVGSFLVVKM